MPRTLTDANRLSLRYPQVAIEWHPTRNGDLTPHDVAYGSNVKRWWVCEKGHDHEWEAAPADRTSGRGCPFCAGRRVADSNRLSTNYPHLVADWHPTRNAELTPHDVTSGSNKKVWWKCDVGEDHDWEDSPNHRTSGRGCPFCAGVRVAESNRLSMNHPELSPEWHPTKNQRLTADELTSASNKNVWWLCAHGHEWEASVVNRTRRGSGCPFCAGKRVTDANRLSVLFPEVAAEWHATRNGNLTPDNISYGSNKSRWWQCEQGHEWRAVVSDRTLDRNGCPYCSGRRVTDANRLSILYPDVAKEWHPARNGDVLPEDVHYSGNKERWWLCSQDTDHEWEDTPNHRTAGRGCPYCAGKRVADSNRLSTNYPQFVSEWHPSKNGDLTPDDVVSGTNRRVWWLCRKGHEWTAIVASRVSGGHGCPYCSGHRVSDANRLSLHYPEVAKEWHPTRNGDLAPDDVALATNRKVWWTCDNGHEWEAFIPGRTLLGHGCPYCAGLLVSDTNRLSLRSPDVAKEWHPTKNGDLTPADVSYGTDKPAWWLCERGHEWDAPVSSRVCQDAGCPYCSGRRVTDDNRLSCKDPELAKEWHPSRNGELTPHDVSYGSGQMAWWICERGHEWEARINSRYEGNQCRSCSLPHRSKVEIYLACELAAFFDDLDPTQTHKISVPVGRTIDVDIWIPSQDLVVEYDGMYWHRNKLGADKKKTEMLQSAELVVLRIREEPLDPVQLSDLRCPVTNWKDRKSLVDRVLIHLQEVFGIEIPGVDQYLMRRTLANKAAGDEIMGRELDERHGGASKRPNPAVQLRFFERNS